MLDITITNNDIGLDPVPIKDPKIRIASRGIVFKDDKIAIFQKKLKNECKLPGGGCENFESIEESFKREVLEETGCKVEILKKLGQVIEVRSNDDFIQISFIFLANVIEDTSTLNLTKKELDEGGDLVWCFPSEGLNMIVDAYSNLKSSSYESLYHTQFINKRDQEILKYFINTTL